MTDDTAREALARVIWETSRADEGTISATGADIVADAILASPAIDAIVAERVAALAEDEAVIARLYRESRGSRSLGDIRMVLRALAAALTERSQS